MRLGAVIVILALAVDPFAQQLIQLRQELRFVDDPNSNTLYRAERYSRGNEVVPSQNDPDSSYSSLNADFAMQSAILYGLSQPISNVVQQSQYTCPSSNCSWEAFDSLAVCGACNNQASHVERLHSDELGEARRFNDVTTFQLPNGLTIDNLDNLNYTIALGLESVWMTTFGTSNPNDTNSFGDSDSLIWSMSIFKIHPNASNASAVWPDFAVEATECGIYYCVNSYKSSVQNAVLYEETTRRTSAFRNPESWQFLYVYPNEAISSISDMTEAQNASIAFDNITSAANRSDLQLLVPSSSGKPTAYNLSQSAVHSISAYFQSTFTGKHQEINPNGYYKQMGQVPTVLYEPSINQALWETDNLTALFEGLAVSMSNAIRSGADIRTPQQGKTGIMITYYEVEWPWISLYITLYVASVAFLIVTMYQGREKAPVWKGSSLAALSFGARVGGIFQGMVDVDEMEHEAGAEEVKLMLEYDDIPLDDLQVVSTATTAT